MRNSTDETTGRWPCPQEAENIPLWVIARIMNTFNISIGEYMKNRLHYLEKAKKLGYIE